MSNKAILVLFIALGFLLYGNTLGHQFALDDAIAITENDFTKQGFSGIWKQLSNDQFVGFYGEKKELVSGGRYRPLSFVIFNIQYELFGENAFIGHLTNVLFYILNGFLLFLVLKKLFLKYKLGNQYFSLPLLASLLWFFHPIHTEVVANIKGLDEILAFTLLLAALLFVIKFLESKSNYILITLSATYFLALLSKENAITWLAVIPLSMYFFSKTKIKQELPVYLTLLITAAIWFIIRYQIVGGSLSNVADNLMNDPFLESTISKKYSTITLTLGKYIQLLLLPHPLTYDYYPKHIPIVNWNNSSVILTQLIYISLMFIAFKGFLQKNIISFSILFYITTISIVSNLIFPIGAFMNERFIYVSSLGFSIVSAYLLLKFIYKSDRNNNPVFHSILIFVFLLYSVKTISRNNVWKNNYTLSTHDANISVNGAKSNVMAGGILSEMASEEQNQTLKKELLERSIFHLNRAISSYPQYIDALLLMGNSQWEYSKNARNSVPYYLEILSINPTHQNTWQNLFIILEQSNDAEYKIQTYQTLLRYNSSKPNIYLNLGRIYGREKNDLTNSKRYLEAGLKIAPNNHDLLTNLGTLYGIDKSFVQAIEVLEKAIQLKPEIAKTHIDLGFSYYYLGQTEKAKKEFKTAVELDNTLNRSQFPI